MSFHFRGQRTGEKVVLFTRQHPICLLHYLRWTLLVFLLPFFFYIFLAVGTVWYYLSLVCVAVGLLRFGLEWYAWFNTMLVVTNERLIWVHQKNMIHREIAECRLESIQQINHKIKGIFGTLFGYGVMEVALGSSQSTIIVKNLPEPYDVQQEILKTAKKEV